MRIGGKGSRHRALQPFTGEKRPAQDEMRLVEAGEDHLLAALADLEAAAAFAEIHRLLPARPDVIDRPGGFEIAEGGQEPEDEARVVTHRDLAEGIDRKGRLRWRMERRVDPPFQPGHIGEIGERAAWRECSKEAREALA